MKYIIYDFNGTILDDLDSCISCLNKIIKKYLKREEINKEEYLEIFDFPVIDYYRRVGFDFNKLSFEEVGQEWMDLYDDKFQENQLIEGIKESLEYNLSKGYKNIIISASRKDKLIYQCEVLGIKNYFEEILGIDNIYASSKIKIAKAWSKDKDLSNSIMFGDTIHDLEVAKEIGVDCILISQGHQSYERLKQASDRVYHSIKEVDYD